MTGRPTRSPSPPPTALAEARPRRRRIPPRQPPRQPRRRNRSASPNPIAPDTEPPTAPASLTGSFSAAGLTLAGNPRRQHRRCLLRGLPQQLAAGARPHPRRKPPPGRSIRTGRTSTRSERSTSPAMRAGSPTLSQRYATNGQIFERIPQWAWQLLAWQERAQHVAKPITPTTIPAWYSPWKAWRLSRPSS